MEAIKYRAWDKKEKKMLYELDNLRIVPDGTLVHDPGFTAKDIILLQYIGLKDLNLKEIYKEDIVLWEDEEGLMQGVIKWDKNNAQFNIDVRALSLTEFLKREIPKHKDWKHKLEVIGNTFQNPDLWAPGSRHAGMPAIIHNKAK